MADSTIRQRCYYDCEDRLRSDNNCISCLLMSLPILKASLDDTSHHLQQPNCDLLYLSLQKGKTCGFLMPTFHLLLTTPKSPKRGTPSILILAPTRELACQIEEECVRFGKSSDIRSTCIYGGVPKSPQIRKIQGGIEVLVATPGRLNDILDVNAVDLSRIEFLGETLPLVTTKRADLMLLRFCYCTTAM